MNKFAGVVWIGIAGALAAAAAPPTFNRDIAPILYKNCATCHRPGEVAPFSLLTYQDAAKRAKQIAAVTQSRFMPPWKAEPGYGSFQNERRLTDDQIAMLGEWAANGAPEGDAGGDPGAKPTPPVFSEGWQAGQPDKVFTLPEKFSLAADGPDQYRCFVVPMNLDHDVYVKSFEFRPDNRRVVHHAIVFSDPSGAARKLVRNGNSYPCFGGPGFGPTGLVGGWAPGGSPGVFAKGMELTVAKGTDLVLQIHYHPSGKPELDQSSLGMTFGEAPTIGRGLVFINSRAIDISAGESHYVVKTGTTIPQDVEVLGITPHAHYLAKDMKIDCSSAGWLDHPHDLDQGLGFQLAGAVSLCAALEAAQRHAGGIGIHLRQLGGEPAESLESAGGRALGRANYRRNGGGFHEREAGLARRRTDVPAADGAGVHQ